MITTSKIKYRIYSITEDGLFKRPKHYNSDLFEDSNSMEEARVKIENYNPWATFVILPITVAEVLTNDLHGLANLF